MSDFNGAAVDLSVLENTLVSAGRGESAGPSVLLTRASRCAGVPMKGLPVPALKVARLFLSPDVRMSVDASL